MRDHYIAGPPDSTAARCPLHKPKRFVIGTAHTSSAGARTSLIPEKKVIQVLRSGIFNAAGYLHSWPEGLIEERSKNMRRYRLLVSDFSTVLAEKAEERCVGDYPTCGGEPRDMS